MLFSRLFSRTLRAVPANVTRTAEQFAMRAALVRQLDSGIFAFLPLGARVIARWQARARTILTESGAQEILAPASGDTDALIASLAREIQSFRQLPARLFWFDGARLTISAFGENEAIADESLSCIAALAARGELVPRIVEGFGAEVWISNASDGDAEYFFCPAGHYAASADAARLHKGAASDEPLLPLEQVATPECKTIDALAQFLNIPTARTAKAVFYMDADNPTQLLFVVVRGDLAVSETKLKRALGIKRLRFATDNEIRAAGAVAGYASPIGLSSGRVIVDDSVTRAPNLVAGANRAGCHLKNTNIPRDYQAAVVADLVAARAGDPCPHCAKPLQSGQGYAIARLENVDARSRGRLQLTFLDSTGKAQSLTVVAAQFDFEQALFALIDAHHDDKGILFPGALAPFDVHLVALNTDKPEVAQAATRLHDELAQGGVSVLYDDRTESAGVKFNDADLIGIPIRATIGPRTLAQQSAEIKRRSETEARVVKLEKVVAQVRDLQ